MFVQSAAMSVVMWIEYIQTGAIILTLGVLIWYTIETSGLRRSAKEQNKLSVRPCITFCFPDPHKRIPIFKNIGRGPAFNIFIKDFVPIDSQGEKITFSIIDFLEPNQSGEISFSLISPGGQIEFIKDMSMDIFPLNTYDFEVYYQSLEGDWYLSTVSADLKNTRFIFKTIRKLSRENADLARQHIYSSPRNEKITNEEKG